MVYTLVLGQYGNVDLGSGDMSLLQALRDKLKCCEGRQSIDLKTPRLKPPARGGEHYEKGNTASMMQKPKSQNIIPQDHVVYATSQAQKKPKNILQTSLSMKCDSNGNACCLSVCLCVCMCEVPVP